MWAGGKSCSKTSTADRLTGISLAIYTFSQKPYLASNGNDPPKQTNQYDKILKENLKRPFPR